MLDGTLFDQRPLAFVERAAARALNARAGVAPLPRCRREFVVIAIGYYPGSGHAVISAALLAPSS